MANIELTKMSDKTQVMICKLLFAENGKYLNKSSVYGYRITVHVLNDVLKILGISTNSVLDANYFGACIDLNEKNLLNDSLNVANFIKPTLKEFQVSYIRTYATTYDDTYGYTLELYKKDSLNVEEIVETEDHNDSKPYWHYHPDNSDYNGDSDFMSDYINFED